MISISLYYLISSVIVLPGVTFLSTRYYFNKKIENLHEHYTNLIDSNQVNRILLHQQFEFDEDAISIKSPELTYYQKQHKLEEHFKKINESLFLQ